MDFRSLQLHVHTLRSFVYLIKCAIKARRCGVTCEILRLLNRLRNECNKNFRGARIASIKFSFTGNFRESDRCFRKRCKVHTILSQIRVKIYIIYVYRRGVISTAVISLDCNRQHLHQKTRFAPLVGNKRSRRRHAEMLASRARISTAFPLSSVVVYLPDCAAFSVVENVVTVCARLRRGTRRARVCVYAARFYAANSLSPHICHILWKRAAAPVTPMELRRRHTNYFITRG